MTTPNEKLLSNIKNEEKKKYTTLEPILQKINRLISLDKDNTKRNNRILNEIIPPITQALCLSDPTFAKMYQNIYFGGSFYDGLKVRNPDEFDLDLILVLPKLTNPVIEPSPQLAGFVQVKLLGYEDNKAELHKLDFRNLDKFVQNGYLNVELFRRWFESVLSKAINRINAGGFNRKFTWHKSGPAFTLDIPLDGENVSVDLVPTFCFNDTKYWPQKPFRQSSSNSTFLIVPKSPKSNAKNSNMCWRLSFQDQEKTLMNSKQWLKVIIKLLKLLRDEQQHQGLSSYYIKTVVLWMREAINDDTFWCSNPLSFVFMMALKYYRDMLLTGKIPYYWNKNNNLVGGIAAVTVRQWGERYSCIIKNIEKNLPCPDELEKVIVKYFAGDAQTIEEGIGRVQNGTCDKFKNQNMDNSRPSCPDFKPGTHKRFLRQILREIPRNDGNADPNRVVIAHFAVLGLGILGELNSLSHIERERLINWIYSLQVVDEINLTSGFQGSPIVNSNECSNYRLGHLTNTYSSLAVLLHLGDDLSRVDKSGIIKGLRKLQNEDGSFTATRFGGTESDLRFVFCASSVSFILNDWSGIDVVKMIEFIKSCITYECGFGQTPGCEAHCGSTFCALSALYLCNSLDQISENQKFHLVRWLANKVNNGFSGRTNKPVDTCYSFWTGGSLFLLDAYKLLAPYMVHRHSIMYTQYRKGGLAKFQDFAPDPLHTSLGLAGLSMMEMDGLKPIFVPLVVTRTAYNHLKSLHRRWNS